MIEFINFYLVPGLALGSIYALGAIGISMIFGILRFAHFAHGDVMTLGAYATLTAVWALGLHPLLALPVGIAFAILAALLVDRVFYKPLRELPTIYTVIASFGVALIFRSSVQLIWGSQNEVFIRGVQKPLVVFDLFRVSLLHVESIAIIVLSAIALHYFLSRTRTGRSMRSTWIIGASLAAVAGVLSGLDTNIHPNLGWNLILPMFAAAILGGIGKPMGALLGGMVIALVEELSSYPWITDEPLINPSYKTATAFFIMVVLLIFRPQGLLRGRLF
ncbi:MAG: branched-chain amino acid ABC transporter permease [Alphaproteobacteria bacterium]|nr:MAG: branched-chain amino acid ABC transporter permease [Alphaproteobacteria bacterium]